MRLGLDATPSRADGSALGLFDELVEVADIATGVELGRASGWTKGLVPARIIGPDEAVKNLADEPFAFYREHCAGRSGVVFAANRTHAHELVEAFNLDGVPAAVVLGNTKWATRVERIRQFRAGEVKVLVGVDVFLDGFDAPRCSAVIIARGVGHFSTWLQMIGRGLRVHPDSGKVDCIVGDLRGLVHKHRFPETPRQWSLTGKAITLEEGLLPARLCPDCHAWGAGGACVFCGAALPPPPPPKVTKKELREQHEAELRAGNPKDWELFKKFVRLAMDRDWKRSAPMMRFAAVRGYRPRGFRFEAAQREILAEREQVA